MEFTVQQIAHILKGEIKGNSQIKIKNLAKIQEGKEGDICFLSNLKYENYLYTTTASAVIVSKDFEPKKNYQPTLIIVEDAYTAFSVLLEEYVKIINLLKIGIEQPSFIAPTCTYGENLYLGAFAYLGNHTKIGKNVKIYPHVYIGDNVSIGDDTILYSGVKVYADCKIGRSCTIQSGAIIGSDGFGFAPQTDGTYKTIPQVGTVIIEDNVDIGANTTIDRATMGATIIENGVKLDNLIQIAHNVRIGKNTVIASHTGISGSTTIGENCIIAGQVGFVGHITVANRTTIGAQSGITNSIDKEGTTLLGSPAIDHREQLKNYVIARKLPELKKRIDELEKKIVTLQLSK
ncbi:MAG: UDP-3-O-(3-hydroxymyristoyl)glucosamine N-acyltransferase [Thermoflexibacter sp.]|jgi:UDP-3-O-[3-hydroxymyristoyl] glucosamine N-acyltransferase|nr:UDP-3-O-(3-hydroxymyristoyl)glucosamine N-acyltransferase [Thermoflexibacter sp.]